PRFKVTGRLNAGLGKEEAVEGLVWLDHQFGNFGPVPGSQGYEWFSIQLDNGVDIICYNIWENGQVVTPLCCWMDDQMATHCTDTFELTPLDFWTDAQGRRYAKRWRVKHPVSGPAIFDILIQTTMDDQKINFLLYEGTTIVPAGSTYNGQPVQGVGYAELTHKATLRLGNLNK
nr:hypothetical protein [Clostridia bacterium]